MSYQGIDELCRDPRRPAEVLLAVDADRFDDVLQTLHSSREARFVTEFETSGPDATRRALFATDGELVTLQAPVVRNGRPAQQPIVPDPDRIVREVEGAEVFTIPYGPVRSGVFEAIQFGIETAGEDVLRVHTQRGFKYRGIEARFVQRSPEMAVHLAERVAGIAGTAYACAFSTAIERALFVDAPPKAKRWRAVLCELERLACHLDVIGKEAETAALSVGKARFQILKEETQRLRALISGSRFGRGLVVPGGLRREVDCDPVKLRSEIDRLEANLRCDRDKFLATVSMSDRLIGTGRLERELLERYGAVGPLARGSAISTDARHERPYGDYDKLGVRVVIHRQCDALSRIRVRFGESLEALKMIRQALEQLERQNGEYRVELPAGGSGAACGWVEAPQGELVIWASLRAGLVEEVHVADPSTRNWVLFEHAFPKDVLTDFGFIEHSFGLSVAGADR